MSKLTIEQAVVRFGNFEALKGLSLTAEHGQFVTLLGPSGCGKTTLLKAVAGFIPLTSGRIGIGDRDQTEVPPERRDTAMCFQSYALFPHLTVADNIVFGLRQKRVAADEIAQRLSAVADQVSLQAHLKKLPSQLSGGQQQRVALARAMAVRPGVMLFDEPLSNLDAKLRDQVRLQIRQLQRAHGFTALYVTHDQSEALAMSDVVVVMNAGNIEQIGSAEDVYYRPANRFVADFVGTANILPVKIVDRSTANGQYRVATPFGEAIVTSDEAPISDHVYACWRPEDTIPVTAGQSQPNQFQWTVKAKTFLGNVTDLALGPESGEAEFRAQVLGHSSLAEGAKCTFEIAPSKLRFLKEDVR